MGGKHLVLKRLLVFSELLSPRCETSSTHSHRFKQLHVLAGI